MIQTMNEKEVIQMMCSIVDMNRHRQTKKETDPLKLPSTTSHYKTCTKNSPVPLRTTNLAQSTSHYYFILQSLREVLPNTTSYCSVKMPDAPATTSGHHLDQTPGPNTYRRNPFGVATPFGEIFTLTRACMNHVL